VTPGTISAMKLEPLDLTEATTLAAFHRLYRDVTRHDTPDQAILDPQSLRATMSAAQPHTQLEQWVARDGDTLIGFCDLVLPQRENRTKVHSEAYVHPRWRRRGVGSALLQLLRDRARVHGRTEAIVAVWQSIPGGRVHHDGAGSAFLTAQGLRQVHTEPRRRLDVTMVDDQMLADLAANARPHATDYELITWRNRADCELAADLAALEARLETDIPTGDRNWEPAGYDEARWRELESMGAKRKRTLYYAAARHRPSGRLVGYTGMLLPMAPRSHAHQITTVVEPEHRGHRLGLLLKIANLAHIRQHEPELRYIDTSNAADNAPMIAINDAIGFQVCDVHVEYALRIG
jgi:GNAT superfamily N-acetyltransferase